MCRLLIYVGFELIFKKGVVCFISLGPFSNKSIALRDGYIEIYSVDVSGTVFIIPVFGGYISDTYAGKYNTILGSGLIYLLGKYWKIHRNSLF